MVPCQENRVLLCQKAVLLLQVLGKEGRLILCRNNCTFHPPPIQILLLFGIAASRFVEDMLADLDRPDIFLGPLGGYFPIVEIQGATGSVLELAVEGLAGDFLGARVGLFLLCVIQTAIAPPRELAVTLLAALLDNSTDGVWEALMADSVHNDTGDGFHAGITLAPGLPVDAAGKTGDRIVQGLFAARITACAWGLVMIWAGVGGALLPSGAVFFPSTSALLLAVSAFCAWSAALTWLSRRNVASKQPISVAWSNLLLQHAGLWEKQKRPSAKA